MNNVDKKKKKALAASIALLRQPLKVPPVLEVHTAAPLLSGQVK
jgi:hypothetical protein